MNPILLLAAVAAPPLSAPADEPDEAIVVTAAREAVAVEQSGPLVAAPAEIIHGSTMDLPTVADRIRGTPGVAVAVSGPRGSQTQVRIRGAERPGSPGAPARQITRRTGSSVAPGSWGAICPTPM